jgi:hypothetical protein
MTLMNFDSNHLKQLTSLYVDDGINQGSIWKLCNKECLFDLIKADTGKNSEYLIKFSDVVSEVLNKKLSSISIKPANKLLDGKWLLFYPSFTMFDQLAD